MLMKLHSQEHRVAVVSYLGVVSNQHTAYLAEIDAAQYSSLISERLYIHHLEAPIYLGYFLKVTLFR
jgi:hypothetical protein